MAHADPRRDAGPVRVALAACPACGSARRHHEIEGCDPFSGHVFELVRCEECGLVYIDPRPEGDALAYYYGDYYGARHPVFKDFFMGVRVRKLGTPPPGARLLDVGCGRGDFLDAARRRGWEVAGIEHGGSPIMQRRDSAPFPVAAPEALPTLPSAGFDAVTFWHVLEHLLDPREQLAQAHRLLKPHGRLLVEVPNFGGWQARIGRAAWNHLDVPRHLLHFNRRALTQLLDATGFEPVRWETLSVEYDVFGFVQTVLNRVCTSPNHLFQRLIRQPSRGGARDSAVSFTLFAPLTALAVPVTLAAAFARQGGVLRVTARPRPAR